MWDTMSGGLTPISPPLDICPVLVFCKYMKTKQVKCGHGLIDQVLSRTGLIRAYCLLRRTWDREPNQLHEGGRLPLYFCETLFCVWLLFSPST